QLYSQLDSQLRSQLDSQLHSQLDSQLRSQLYSQLDSQLDSQLYSQLRSQLYSQPWYVGCWWRAWSGWYLGAKKLGVRFDNQALDLFVDWNEMASCWCAYEGLCVVSRNPVDVHWQDGELHNDSGMSVRYADGWGVYSLAGVAVDQQIVESPETQTIEQIQKEDNEEVKRIRIERFGWERYLREVNASVVDSRINEIEGTHEGLFATPDGMRAFVGRCRSTGRVYFLEVEPSIQTCEQAQVWMRGGRQDLTCIGAS
ncbi:MAG: hypothetical protein KDB22_26085, partial [Planctomycetales bacterium]|nr:hypothetical protein [Planctomycetales bacterium]